ncbi:MAG: hypothetical protein WBG30_12775 [Psychrilyobacter sp.]|uniref:hypothetical protein n=1 Tax=Psychrilyobacter sp. TaxID=2586924 RepID=UPI003C73CAEC
MAQKMNGQVSFLMEFKERYTQAIIGQGAGVVGLILPSKINTSFTTKKYYTLADVKAADWSPEIYKLFKELVFRGVPTKVIAYRIEEAPDSGYVDMTHLSGPYKYLSKICDYIAYPGGKEDEHDALVGMVKKDRVIDKLINPFQKPIKLVVATSTSPDSPYIINLKQKHTVNEIEFTSSQYTGCIVGCIAGVGLANGSMTYYKQPWVESVEESTDINADVGNGYLITVADTDGENLVYRTERGINSFITPIENMGRTFSKIRCIELMDINLKDIQYTYKNYYIGKRKNTYANKMAFAGAVNAYLKMFMTNGDLDTNYGNNMIVDSNANKTWALGNGKITEGEAAKMDDYRARRLNTKDKSFYRILEYTPVDVMEDAEVIVEVI